MILNQSMNMFVVFVVPNFIGLENLKIPFYIVLKNVQV
jgi:hypothetical protein